MLLAVACVLWLCRVLQLNRLGEATVTAVLCLVECGVARRNASLLIRGARPNVACSTGVCINNTWHIYIAYSVKENSINQPVPGIVQLVNYY